MPELQDMSFNQLVKAMREIFEKDPPLQLTNLTVDELRVLKLFTVDERTSFAGVRLLSVGRPGAPAFKNAWVNFGGGYAGAMFWKDPTGVVHLAGRISTGVLNNPAFTLPPGYRPPGGSEQFAAISNGALGVLEVQTDGDVIPVSGSATSFSLSGAKFRAA